MRRDCKISALSSLFVNPAVAAALGALLGVLLTFVSERSVRLVTPEDPTRGFLLVMMLMGARFAAATAGLGAYFMLARPGLAPFGVALALSFVAGLVFEAVRVSRPHVPRTSA